jgi:N-acetylneuraminic acid mutarotase
VSRRAAPLVLVVALLCAGCIGATTESDAPVDQTTPGTWTTFAAMPTPRQEVAAATLGGRVYVIGGFGQGAEPMPTVEAYDPATNQWEPITPLPVSLHHAAAAVVGDRLFVVGGYTGGRVRWEATQTLFEYDPARASWATRAPMPTARGGHAVAVLGGRLHVVGGSGEAPTQAHEVYDPATDRWTTANPMPTARDHLAAVAFQGRLWAMGGRESFLGTQFANVEVYDPATDSWRVAAALPAGRGGLGAAVLGDRLLVFGGEAPFRIFNATEMYEPAGGRWIAKAAMPTARHGIAVAAAGGRVYVIGGGSEPGYAPTNLNEAYTP